MLKEREGVVRAMNIDAVVLGGVDAYNHARDVIRSYRMLVRRLYALAQHYEILHAPVIYDSKKRAVVARLDRTAAKQAARDELGASETKTRFRELKPLWERMTAELAASGGPCFGASSFDQAVRLLKSIHGTRMPDYGKLTRGYLVLQGYLDRPKLEHIGLALRHDSSVRQVELARDDRGYTLTATYGPDKQRDRIVFLLHGVTCCAGKEYSAVLSNYQQGIWQNVMEQRPGWHLGGPTINMRMKRSHHSKGKYPHFWIQIPYEKPRTDHKAIPGRVCEVAFERIAGRHLRRRKHDTGTDDDKTFVIHAACCGRAQHLNVDGVTERLLYLQRRKRELELQRDGRRRFNKRNRMPISDRIKKLRTNRENLITNQNRDWVKRLISFAAGCHAGTVRLYGLPDGVTKGLLLDGSVVYNWSQFGKFLRDACDEGCIAFEAVDGVDVSSIMRELSRGNESSEEAAE